MIKESNEIETSPEVKLLGLSAKNIVKEENTTLGPKDNTNDNKEIEKLVDEAPTNIN